MESCIYKGEEICAYELKDSSGIYQVERVEELKLAASRGELVCRECGSKVYLAAGLIKEPYFAHYDLTGCEYSANRESEEALKGKRLLYHLLRTSFPEEELYTRYKLKNGLYCSFYLPFTDGKPMAVEFRLYNTGIDEFYIRDQYYREEGITPVYVLGYRVDKNDRQLSWYQNLIQKSMGYCAFLDAVQEKIYLKKSYYNRFEGKGRVRLLRKDYPVKELLLNRNGILSEEFMEECSKTEKAFALPEGIREDILENALRLVKEGQGHLVSEKYRNFIRERKLLR